MVVRGDGSVLRKSTRGAESDSGGFVVVDMAVQDVAQLISVDVEGPRGDGRRDEDTMDEMQSQASSRK